jgi:hypothetical protein
MDVNFNATQRKNKKQRKVDEMVLLTENIFGVTANFIISTHSKISAD